MLSEQFQAILEEKGTLRIAESVVPMFPPFDGDDDADPVIRMLLKVKKAYKKNRGVVITFTVSRSEKVVTIQSWVSCHDKQFKPEEIIKYREDFLHEAAKVLDTFVYSVQLGHSLEESEHIAKEFANSSIEESLEIRKKRIRMEKKMRKEEMKNAKLDQKSARKGAPFEAKCNNPAVALETDGWAKNCPTNAIFTLLDEIQLIATQ